MTTDTNVMGVPEIRHYHREAIEGGIAITYEVRRLDERDWTSVKLFRSAEMELAQRHDASYNRDIDIAIGGL